MVPAILACVVFVFMLLFGPPRGRAWLDYRRPLEDPAAGWRAFAGWAPVRALVVAALGWVLVSLLYGSTTAWEASGLAAGGWIVAAAVTAAFEASKPDE